jgi:hypothetical protein
LSSLPPSYLKAFTYVSIILANTEEKNIGIRLFIVLICQIEKAAAKIILQPAL